MRGKRLSQGHEEGMTCREIAKVLGISSARVQQIEVQAMKKLRARFSSDLVPQQYAPPDAEETPDAESDEGCE